MNVILHCEPNTPPMSWEEFAKSAPRQSIAIDGFVKGKPMFDPERLVMNANHHEEVERFPTRCTAAQLALQIRMGLFQAFDPNLPLHVFFNDCDQDVCLSIWLLRNGPISRNIVNPILNRILSVEDMLDTTAGSYGFPADMPGAEENNWIFESYNLARHNGTLVRRNPREFIQVIDAAGSRIDQAISGRGQRLALDPRYDVISSHPKWSMVQEIGSNARGEMSVRGITAFGSVLPRGDGRWSYSVGRNGIWIQFDVPAILRRLTEVEGDPNNCWGGGDTIGGSPRSTGSRLSPEEVTQIVNEVVG